MKPDVSLHAEINWYLLLLELEGLLLYMSNKVVFLKFGYKCKRVILIHFLVWSEEVLLTF